MFSQNIFSTTIDPVFIMDEKYYFVDVNQAACDSLEYTREELIDKSVLDIDPTITQDKYTFLLETFHDSDQKTRQIQTKHKTKSGRILDIEITTSVFKIENESYRIAIAKDIAKIRQRKYEHSLLKFAFDNNQESAFLIDKSGRFVYVNQAYCKMQGYSLDELLSMSVFDVNTDISKEEWPKHWEELKNVGALIFESHNQTRTGKVYPVEISTNYFEFDGKSYNIGTMKDISERKKYEKQIGLASIGQLSAGITHEINTPLTYIKGRLELMRYSIEDMHECDARSDMIYDLESIQDGILRMSHIIDSMREIAGKSRNKQENIDIYNSFLTTLVMIHNKAKYIASIYLNEELFTLSMKKSDKPLNAYIEKQRMEQVWIIILNNALDALEQKSVFENSRIWISIDESDNEIIVTIEDNAGGIPDELLPVIFDPFTSTKEHGGMGIGLNIAKKIVEEQNGTIEITNSQQGASITILLPKIKV